MMLFGCTKKDDKDKNVTLSADSLATYLSLANENNMPYEYKQKYNKKAFEIIIRQKNDSLTKAQLFKVANRYYNMNDWESYKKISSLILEKSKSSHDSVHIARAYTYIGDYYQIRAVSDSAFIHYFAAEKLYIHLNDDYNLAKTLLSKANLQFNEGDLFKSEIIVFKALQLLKKQKNVSDLFYVSYNLLGILYNSRDEYSKALEFHNKALLTLEDKTVPAEFQYTASSLNNIGFVYLSMHNYHKAKKHFQKGLEQKNLFSENTTLYAMLLDNLAYSKFKLGESAGLPGEFFKALKISENLHLESGIILNKIHLSEYFAYHKDTLKAIEYAKQALVLSGSYNKLTHRLEVLKQIALIDPKNASAYSKDYIETNEKVKKRDRVMGEKFSRIEYETNEIKDINTSLNEQNRNLIFIFSFCGLIGIFLYVYKTQKARHRELLFKQQQQIANEDIYNLMISQQNAIEAIRVQDKKRVSRDLHDGILGRMFGVRISLDSLDKLDEATAAVKRKKYLSELKEIEQDIRDISHDLNKEKSEVINNFVAIIDKLLENQRATFNSGLIAHIDSSIKWELIANSIKINLYRIVQEALQNCNKYSKAKTITIEFKNEVDYLFLIISDDGVGFNINKSKKGIGLQNIFYRTKECDGEVAIKSHPGEGTTIEIRIPIDQKIKLRNNDT